MGSKNLVYCFSLIVVTLFGFANFSFALQGKIVVKSNRPGMFEQLFPFRSTVRTQLSRANEALEAHKKFLSDRGMDWTKNNTCTSCHSILLSTKSINLNRDVIENANRRFLERAAQRGQSTTSQMIEKYLEGRKELVETIERGRASSDASAEALFGRMTYENLAERIALFGQAIKDGTEDISSEIMSTLGWRAPTYPVKKAASVEAVTNFINIVNLEARSTSKGIIAPGTQSAVLKEAFKQFEKFVNDRGENVIDWLDGFRNFKPLEDAESPYMAAVLALEAINKSGLSGQASVQIAAIKRYLSSRFSNEKLHNKVLALKNNGEGGNQFLTVAEQKAVVDELLSLSRSSDGSFQGWSSASLMETSSSNIQPDAYATSIALLGLLKSKQFESDPLVQQAVSAGFKWLLENSITSSAEGGQVQYWKGYSFRVNGESPKTNEMATSFAIEAIELGVKLKVLEVVSE